MKPVPILLVAILTIGFAGASLAQSRIYRCGNEYTNNPPSAQKKGCTAVEGGNVTVIEGPRAQPAPSTGGYTPPRAGSNSNVVTAPPPGAPRVDASDQRARDADARAILETELRKAEARQAELLRQYNGGTPERIAGEVGNDLRYQTRTADLKAALDRIESDLAGIRRELGRVASR